MSTGDLMAPSTPLAGALVESPGEVDYDMNDARVVDALPEAPNLASALSVLQQVLLEPYRQADAAAIKHQKMHHRYVIAAAWCGSGAVILAILQLGVGGLEASFALPGTILRVLEFLAAAGVSLVVFAGIRSHVHHSWLDERHRAERYRLLKFRSLADCGFWGSPGSALAAWRRKLETEQSKIASDSIKNWVDNDEPFDPPEALSLCAFDVPTARSLKSYYHAKRIAYQKKFFESRIRKFQEHDSRLRHLPVKFFFAGVAFALLHFALDSLGPHGQASHMLSRILIIMAACAPILGAGIRTYRLAHEFARSANLYRAKCAHLSDLESSFKALPEDAPVAILLAIWKCEQYLEREHYEWHRLMRETEWFG